MALNKVLAVAGDGNQVRLLTKDMVDLLDSTYAYLDAVRDKLNFFEGVFYQPEKVREISRFAMKGLSHIIYEASEDAGRACEALEEVRMALGLETSRDR